MSTEVIESNKESYYESLGSVAEFVRAAANRIKSNTIVAAEKVIESGLELKAVKAQLEHGQFERWLSIEFKWTHATACNYMNAASHFSDISNGLNFAPTALYMLSSPNVPESARQEAKDIAASGETVTPTKAREIIGRYSEKCPNCGGEEWASDDDGEFCPKCKEPGPTEPRVIERDLSADQEPVISRTQRNKAANLRAEADVIIRQVIDAWPSDDFEDLDAWWKGWRKEIKKGSN